LFRAAPAIPTNLLKLVIYVRSAVANPNVKQYFRESHPQQLEVFEQIIDSTERSDGHAEVDP
jgi:hypothetical protein